MCVIYYDDIVVLLFRVLCNFANAQVATLYHYIFVYVEVFFDYSPNR